MRTTVPFPSKWQNHVFSSHLFFLHMNNILVRVQTHSFLTVWIRFLPRFYSNLTKKRFFKLPGIWRFHKVFGLFVDCKARVSSDNYVKALNFDRERRKLSYRIIISVILIILMHNSGTQCRIFHIYWSI